MRGRQVFMESLVAHGSDAIFGNPGTTENPILDSLAEYPGVTYYTALHEAVAVCAASFYAQASGKTPVASLHVAPGLGNAIGVIYGALKACSPLVITAGQQDTRMRLRNPILRHDLVAMAAPVTKWAVEAQSADEIAPIMRRAFKIANEWPRGPVFVSLPNNVMEQDTDILAANSGELYQTQSPNRAAIDKLTQALLASKRPAFIAGDDIAVQGGGEAFAELVELCGASVFVEFLRARQALPAAHNSYRGRIPYNVESIRERLAGHDLVIMVGGQFVEEVWFDTGSPFPPEAKLIQIESADERLAYNFSLELGVIGHIPTTLRALTDSLRSQATSSYVEAAETRNGELRDRKNNVAEQYDNTIKAKASKLPMSPGVALSNLGSALPNEAIIIDEAITAAPDLEMNFLPDGADKYFAGRGGGIGQGVAGALGVAAAYRDELVVAVSGDGSAMYSIQALWTAAHHGLKVIFVILANREYRVLKHNMDIHRDRFLETAEQPYPRMDLANPHLDFVAMAAGMGVPGRRASTIVEIQHAASEAVAADGPYVIEIEVSGKDQGDSRPEIVGR
ncbi:MAG: thiamine pyrophosphate-binding protein [Gammaproteobacteria bacterium]